MADSQRELSNEATDVARSADAWKCATLDESRAWRKLRVSTGISPRTPADLHRHAGAVLRSLNFNIEEEAPTAQGSPTRPGPIEGAVQGEWHVVEDGRGGRSARLVGLTILLASVALFVAGGYGISRSSVELGRLVVLAIILAVIGFAILPRRRFQSDMVWIGYDATDSHGPTNVHVRAAHVWSGNAPRLSRYVRARELFQLADRPDLTELRERVSAQVLQADDTPLPAGPLPA